MTASKYLSVVSVDVLALRREGESLLVGTMTRDVEPFVGELALPGVALHGGERLSGAAARALHRLAGTDRHHELRQLQVFDEPHRDPRGPALSIAMAAAFDPEADFAAVLIGEAASLAFDHAEIVAACAPQIADLLFHDVAFTRQLLGETFTTREAAGMLEALTGETPHRGNFARRLAATGARQVGAAASTGGRPGAVWGWGEE